MSEPLIGRPMQGSKPRVSRTLTIADPSAEFLAMCVHQLSQVNPKAKPGHVFDQMVDHCKSTNFNPSK